MTAMTTRWRALSAAAVVGAAVAGALSDPPGFGIGGYLGGLALVAGAFEFGAFNIKLTAKHAPSLTMVVALASYFTTAIALALVLAASSPRVVSGAAMAAGLLVGMTIWLATLLRDSWVREPPQEPVNIRAQDETISSSRSGGQ